MHLYIHISYSNTDYYKLNLTTIVDVYTHLREIKCSITKQRYPWQITQHKPIMTLQLRLKSPTAKINDRLLRRDGPGHINFARDGKFNAIMLTGCCIGTTQLILRNKYATERGYKSLLVLFCVNARYILCL